MNTDGVTVQAQELGMDISLRASTHQVPFESEVLSSDPGFRLEPLIPYNHIELGALYSFCWNEILKVSLNF